MTVDVFVLERREEFKKTVVKYFNEREDEPFAKEVAFIIKRFTFKESD